MEVEEACSSPSRRNYTVAEVVGVVVNETRRLHEEEVAACLLGVAPTEELVILFEMHLNSVEWVPMLKERVESYVDACIRMMYRWNSRSVVPETFYRAIDNFVIGLLSRNIEAPTCAEEGTVADYMFRKTRVAKMFRFV